MDEGMTWRWIPELCSNDYEMSDIWFICVKVRQFQERTNIVNIYNWFLIVRIQFFHVRFNTLQYYSIMRRECKKKKKNVENDTILLKVKIHRFQVMDGILTVHRYISVIIYRGRKKKKKNARLRWCMQIRSTCKENYDIPDTSDIPEKCRSFIQYRDILGEWINISPWIFYS